MNVPLASVIVSLLVLAGSVCAEEKNGISLTVSKKTLDRNDSRMPYYYSSDRIDRTEGLKVVVKNISFKEMPAGEIIWTLLVKKYYSSEIVGYTGKEPLKALKPADQVEMVIGSAQIYGWADYSSQAKDKTEYQIVVMQGGKETMRSASTSGFDSLAKRADYPSPKKSRPKLVPSSPAPAQ